MRYLIASALLYLLLAPSASAHDYIFRDDRHAFHFLYPDTWIEVEEDLDHVRGAVASDNEWGAAVCAVGINHMPEIGRFTRQFIEIRSTRLLSKSVMVELIGDRLGADIIAVDTGELDNRPAAFALADKSLDVGGRWVHFRAIYALTVTRQGVYGIWCGAPQDRFDHFHPALSRIIKSFVFQNQ